jgi:hypothetical protein
VKTTPSVVLGLSFVAGCLILGIFFGQPFPTRQPSAAPNNVGAGRQGAAAEGGSGRRFQLVTASEQAGPAADRNHNCVYLLDGDTGQCWKARVEATGELAEVHNPSR